LNAFVATPVPAPDAVCTLCSTAGTAPAPGAGAPPKGHAQNILAFQRVVGPDNRTGQVTFCGQADCLQAWKQNHQPDCDPKTGRCAANTGGTRGAAWRGAAPPSW